MEFKARKTGKQNVLRMGIAEKLKRGGTCFVVTKEYPQDICDYLDGNGMKYEIEEIYRTPNRSLIYDVEGVIGFEQKERVLTGYSFKPKEL